MRKKPTILLVAERLQVGGAEKYTVLVANELHARGYRVVILSNQGPFRTEFHPDIRFVRAYFRTGLFGFLYGVLQIIFLSLQEQVSVVHVQKYESVRAAWLARFITRKPILKTVHGYTRNRLTVVSRRINRYADRVVTVVDWLGEELIRNGVSAHKVSVVYNGMNTPPALSEDERQNVRASLGIAADDVVIISVSRLERRKNHAEFFDWFPRILEHVPTAKYVIVGNGNERERLMQKARECRLDHAILFVDATIHIEPYLQMADIFCTPIVAQGMAVLEAMAAGIPVVGTTPGSAPEVVRDGETGFTVPKGDGDAFVQRLIELAQQPEKGRRFGAAGKERQQELFSVAHTVDGLEKIYLEMV